MAALERLVEKRPRLVRVGSNGVRNHQFGGCELHQRTEAPALRLVEQRRAVQVEQVEPERRQRQLRAHASTSSLRPKRRMVI